MDFKQSALETIKVLEEMCKQRLQNLRFKPLLKIENERD